MKLPRKADVMPWTGLVAGMVAAGLQHQVVSDSMHFDCRNGHADVAIGIAALVVIVIGAWVSLRALRANAGADAMRAFVARLGLMGAALFALLVVWQTLAGFILPACPA